MRFSFVQHKILESGKVKVVGGSTLIQNPV